MASCFRDSLSGMAKHVGSGSSLDRIRIDLAGIGAVLKTDRLAVPAYQRDYAWKEQQVAELLGDLAEAIRDQEEEYFLGSIVLSNEEGEELQVTDGQQRLATITILIATIRNYFFGNDDDEQCQDIEADFLLSRHRRTRDVVPKLRLNAHDHQFFEDRVLRRPVSDGGEEKGEGLENTNVAEPESHKRLGKAIKTVQAYIGNVVKTNPNNASEVLLDWLDFVEEKAKVIKVLVPGDSNAFTIFETLNDRGLDLAISDLLKNFLFHRSGQDRLKESQTHWTAMTGLQEATAEDDIVVAFLRHYWSSVYGLTRERDLYKAVKKKITNPKQAADLAGKLHESAKRYAALSNTSHQLWNKYGATAQGHVATLNTLRMTQMRPLLLAILDHFKPAEAQRAFRYLVSCAVRLLMVGGRGGSVESRYSEAAMNIRRKAIKDAAGVRQAMKTVYPADRQFRDAFAIATVSKEYLARYYLRALERAERNEKAPEFIPNANEEEVNLEQVLPQEPGNNWKHLTGDRCKELYKRIGNFALMKSTENSTIGNASFDDKRKVLAKSSFRLTKVMGKSLAWDEDAITARQNYLADLALKTWSGKLD